MSASRSLSSYRSLFTNAAPRTAFVICAHIPPLFPHGLYYLTANMGLVNPKGPYGKPHKPNHHHRSSNSVHPSPVRVFVLPALTVYNLGSMYDLNVICKFIFIILL